MEILPTGMLSINCDLFQSYCSLGELFCDDNAMQQSSREKHLIYIQMLIMILMLQGQCLHVVRLGGVALDLRCDQQCATLCLRIVYVIARKIE